MSEEFQFSSLIDNVVFPELETKILSYWQEQDIFNKTLANRQNSKPYVFYDGPPFATGLPHHGHLLASTIKDIIPRYFTMQGYYVERRFGWDCHGLPIEYEIDKEQGKPCHEVVEEIGIAGYNQLCRNIVQRYTEQWESTITRLGRWVDFKNDYKTMDVDFMESVWWTFKQLWDRDLVYQGTKVVAYSTALGTVLSNFEASSNYQDVQDPSLSVLFNIGDNTKLAVWTTTPWTLPSNLGICVGPNTEYSLLQLEDSEDKIWIASARIDATFKGTPFSIIKTCLGSELAGMKYEPLFNYFNEEKDNGAFVVHTDEFVSTENGTGIVHMAPAFGEDDHRIMSSTKVKPVCPIDQHGIFTSAVPDFSGMYVKDADKEIIKQLKQSGVVLKHETIVHSYPHCPRSDTPLIYRTIPSWYIKVTKIKSKILAANEEIHWVPGHVKHGRFGRWLAGAKDWAVSRNRVWGSPVPLWINSDTQNVKCIGSREELYKLTGIMVTDLHREHVDELTFSLEGEPGVYKRVPEVLDCWFESGAMPYAQKHYPFDNPDKFSQGFPAQFIAEGLDQTRGWFYTLMILSVALFDKPAFKNIIVSGIVTSEDGKKMSKRLKNYTAPDKLINEYGADALRLYLINSNLVKGQEQRFKDSGVKEMVRQTLLPWYNAAKFLTTYADVDKWHVGMQSEQLTILDTWILSRLQSLKLSVTKAMSEYRLYLVVPKLLEFLDELTNIYIRLNRGRFWATGTDADKCAAYSVLYTTIIEFSVCMAPFAPFCSEAIYQALMSLNQDNKQHSVHSKDYPQAAEGKIDLALESSVLRMHQIIVLGRQCRTDAGIKTKIPLPSITIVHKDEETLNNLKNVEHIIKQELNVCDVKYEQNESDYIELSTQPCSPILGKRFGSKFKEIRKIIESMSDNAILEYEANKQITLGEYNFVEGEILVHRKARAKLNNIASNHWVTLQLDCSLNEDLLAQGMAREVINRIQKTRKNMGLHVSDRIILNVYANEDLYQIIHNHQDLIMQETLTLKCNLQLQKQDHGDFKYEIENNNLGLTIEVAT